MSDLDSYADDAFDLKKAAKVLGGMLLAALVIISGVFFFTQGPANQEYDGEFSLTAEDKQMLTDRAVAIVESSGNYGLVDQVDKNNFMAYKDIVANKYYLTTTDDEILTRKAIYEKNIGYLYRSSSIESNYDNLTSDDFLAFLFQVRASDVEVLLPEDGYYDTGNVSSAVVTVQFESTKTLNVAKEALKAWDGDVETLVKTDVEEIELTFKKDENGIWGLNNIANFADSRSLGLIAPSTDVPLSQYEVSATYNVGVTRDIDVHSHENTDDDHTEDEPYVPFEGFEEKDGEIIIPDNEAPEQS